MRLISWNLARRRKTDEQVKAIVEARPDIVALQEVTPTTAQGLRDGLIGHGFFVLDTASSIAGDAAPKRRMGVLIAVKGEFQTAEQIIRAPWPEKALSVGVVVGGVELDVHTVHIPPGSTNGIMKIEVFEAVSQALAVATSRLRVLCGDFNSPQAELPDGSLVTWGQTIRIDGGIRLRNRMGAGTRWDSAERSVLTGLASFDLIDVFRRLYGYKVEGESFWVKRSGKTWPRRFDHVFAAEGLRPRSMRYRVDVVDLELSDHALIEAVFEPAP